MDVIKVFIADDHPIFLQGLKMTIDADPQLKIIGEALDGDEAFFKIPLLEPDIAILDLNMPGKKTNDILRIIQEKEIPTKVLILTMHDEEETFNSMLDLGIRGYVLKDSAVTEIVTAILAVVKGQSYFTPRMATFSIERNHDSKNFVGTVDILTVTERKVLCMIAQNKTTKEIAAELFVSHRTVDRHRNNICHKLDITGINSLLKFAIKNQKMLIDLCP